MYYRDITQTGRIQACIVPGFIRLHVKKKLKWNLTALCVIESNFGVVQGSRSKEWECGLAKIAGHRERKGSSRIWMDLAPASSQVYMSATKP